MNRIESSDAGFIQFVDDDNGYLRWLDANCHGFVVNSARSPSPSYLILHRASCKHINSPNRTNWTTTDLIKTCSTEINALSQWARQQVAGDLQPCGACKPGFERKPTPLPAARSTANVETTFPAGAVAVKQPIRSPGESHRQVPATISTGCPELDFVWKTFATDILGRPHVLIADTEDDLNWHAFLGHSIDMQGFRAAEFVGVDPLSKSAPGFVPLKQRGIGIRQLAGLWEVLEIKEHLQKKSTGTPLQSSLDVLKQFGGQDGRSFAEAFETFPHRKGHWTVRAYLQNSAVLKDYGYSFRHWLEVESRKLGETSFPPADFRTATSENGLTLEMALRKHLERTFYQVGPALAAYMLCDWQLALWHEGRTAVFANFKLDSFHEEFVKKFSRGVIPTDEHGFAEWWLSLYPDLPPRLANECIWIGIEKSIV